MTYLSFRRKFVSIEGRRKYQEEFSQAKWNSLTPHMRKRHSAKDCLACVEIPSFAFKKVNTKFIAEQKPVRVRNETTPTRSIQGNRCDCKKATSRKKHSYEAIKRSVQRQRESSLKNDLQTLYSTGISLKRWDLMRRKQHGVYSNRKKRDYNSDLRLYTCATEVVVKKLEEVAESNKDLGDKMRGRWRELARQASLRRTGHSSLPLNSTQVISLSCNNSRI